MPQFINEHNAPNNHDFDPQGAFLALFAMLVALLISLLAGC